MKTLIYIGGIYHLAFAAFHVLFWKLLEWKRDLRLLNKANRGVMQILNLRLIYVFLIVACLSFWFAESLLTSDLGKVILFAVALFWLMRAVEQIIFFDLKNEISLALFGVFLIGAGIYGYAAIF